MAFTEAQKHSIRFALGYPDVFLDANSRLESAMEVVGSRPTQQAAVEAILANLDAVSTSLVESVDFAGLKRAEDIEWFQSGSGSSVITQKRSEGRRYCGQLSIIFGVPIAADIFSAGGYQGDGWKGVSHQYGGTIKLG